MRRRARKQQEQAETADSQPRVPCLNTRAATYGIVTSGAVPTRRPRASSLFATTIPIAPAACTKTAFSAKLAPPRRTTATLPLTSFVMALSAIAGSARTAISSCSRAHRRMCSARCFGLACIALLSVHLSRLIQGCMCAVDCGQAARQGKARQGKARQGKARQGKARVGAP
jgi:hypothetical protein